MRPLTLRAQHAAFALLERMLPTVWAELPSVGSRVISADGVASLALSPSRRVPTLAATSA
jgi:hypothetical protein